MKFKYNSNKEAMTAYGYDFSDHKEVEIEKHGTNYELICRKLSGNSHFDEVVEKKPAKTQEQTKTETDTPVGATDTNPEPEKTEPEKGPEPDEKEEPKCSGKVGLFRIKGDGKPYSKPDLTFHCKEEAEAHMKENDINPDERLILEKE